MIINETSNEFVNSLYEIFGLQDKQLKELSIKMKLYEVVTIEVTYTEFLESSKGEKFVELIKRYKLEEIKNVE